MDCTIYNYFRINKTTHQTKGGNGMTKERRYTAEQLSDAEKVAKTLASTESASIPEDKRTLVVMMTNSFMAGMEAQKAIDDTKAVMA